MRAKYLRLLLLAALALGACGAPTPQPTPAPPSSPIPEDTATAPKLETITPPTATAEDTATLQAISTPEPSVKFRLAIIVDTASEPVPLEQAEAVLADANGILIELTGYGFELVDFVEDSSGGSVDSIVRSYLDSHEETPNGIALFSYGQNMQAKRSGGYARQILGPSGFRNEFVSTWIGDNQVYVAVIHYSHKYAACGYAGTDSIQVLVSSNGECRGVDGVACVMNYGYQMCEDATENLYASTQTYFAATTLVHEIMHGFSNRANDDHYATASCKTIMGWDEFHFDLAEGQYYASMCPHVYDLFVESYQP